MARKPSIPFNTAAARNGSREMLLYIQTGDRQMAAMEIRANPEIVNRADEDGLTMLHHAVLETQPEIVTMLLNAGAIADTQDKYGETPAHLAQRLGYADIAQEITRAATAQHKAAQQRADTQEFKKAVGALTGGHGYDIPVDVKRARFRKN